MTNAELSKLVGTTGRVNLDGLEVDVKIIDARMSFGRTDVLVVPESGAGQKWIEAGRVKEVKDEN